MTNHLRLRLLLCGRLCRLRRRRLDEEKLPEEQNRDREHDGEDKIAIVLVHQGLGCLSLLAARGSPVGWRFEGKPVSKVQASRGLGAWWTLLSARSRSLVRSVNRRCSVPARAIKT